MFKLCLASMIDMDCQCLCLQGEGAEEGDGTTTPSARRVHPVGKYFLVK